MRGISPCEVHQIPSPQRTYATTLQTGPILQIFSLVDADCSGEVSAMEVKRLMSLLGEDVDMTEVENLITEFDLDGSGEIDLTEFIFVLALQRKSEFRKEDILRCAAETVFFITRGSFHPEHGFCIMSTCHVQ